MDVQRTEAETAYLEAFARAGEVLPSAPWLEAEREAARDRFVAHGLPHRRMEAWRWTDLRTILDQSFPPALTSAADARPARSDASPFADLERYVFVLVDGHLRKDLSDFAGLLDQAECIFLDEVADDAPAWLRESLGHAFDNSDDALSALNTVFATAGVAIRVPDGVKVDRPIEFLFAGSGAAQQTLNTKCLMVLGDKAEATLLETHLGPREARYVSNSWTEAVLGSGAELHHVKLQDDAHEAVHLGTTHAVIGAGASFRTFCLSAGAGAARNQIKVRLAGEGGHAAIVGAYLLTGKQHCDTALLVDHAVPECTSNELFKCVMDDHARGIFQGKIIVRPDAQKTDGMQMSQGLLLSETAEFDAKPELEIFADDVRCTHGATSGELDDEPLFYLRSRGIPEDEAKSLLVSAFVGEAVEQIESEELQSAVEAFVARLRAERKAAG